jgi:Xaa-Pro aminopeptidase
MTLDTARLDDFLAEAGLDGILVDDDGEAANAYYLADAGAPDPFVTLYVDGAVHLLVSELEYGRLQRESRAETVTRFGAYDLRERIEEEGQIAGRGGVLADFLADRGVDAVSVGERFPVGTADGLRACGLTVTPTADDPVADVRSRKRSDEIEAIREAQRANEAAMARAESLIARASVEGDRLLLDGEPLTSERVTLAIERALLDRQCALDDTIVAGGAQGADPHERGSGPLPAGEPIVVDIFPRHKETRYYADMTRTFCRGTPSEALRERFEVTQRAKDAALSTIEPGVTGRAVHDAACAVYEEAGYATLRSDETTETGFIHGTGHGIGLEVHEAPRLSLGASDPLEAGNVVTVEPGLYDPAVGGVRIEDLVRVTESGTENLTTYPTELAPAKRNGSAGAFG